MSPSTPVDLPHWLDVLDLRVSGYVQPQFTSSELSADEVDAEGDALNQDQFTLRRGRLRVDRDFRYVRVALELDANTVHGPTLSVKRVEAGILYPNREHEDAPPYVMLTAGLGSIPFGAELTESNRDRSQLERTTASRAFFVGEYDLGAQLSGGLGPLRYAVAVQNGTPVSDTGDSTDYTSEKTVVGRVGGAADGSTFRVAGGVSFLDGTGFHAATTATKSSLSWTDTNQDGLVSLAELEGYPGQAATESSTYTRWAVGADLDLGLHTPAGWTRVYGEAVLASNLDRGFYVADPVSTGYDIRELGWSVGAVQDVTKWGFVAFRADAYDPNSDFYDERLGQFIPTDASVLTLSPAAGVRIPEVAKLTVQYDYVVDHLARDVSGEPVDQPNDQWTVRGQVQF